MKLPFHWATIYHQHHSGEDAIYALGSQISAEVDVNVKSAQDARLLLQGDLQYLEGLQQLDAEPDRHEADLVQLRFLIKVCDDIVADQRDTIMLYDLATIALSGAFDNEWFNFVASEDCVLTSEEKLAIHKDLRVWRHLEQSVPDMLIRYGVNVEEVVPLSYTTSRINAATKRLGEPLVGIYAADQDSTYEEFQRQMDIDSADGIDVWDVIMSVQEYAIAQRKS